MHCEDEYNSLVKSTERLHELYYQQETVDFAFSNALASAQNHMIASGLVRLATASASEIVNALEDNAEKGFFELHDAAESKVQIDTAVRAAEESYRDACQRYDECVKRQTGEVSGTENHNFS
ncbi:MAG: hypothetical protein KGH99_00455 [Thaumarchaeota archaeon]|nr:hypothetical protein [Nitrososphaerota archaeon]MDE1871931.1 hypothetical protein [Nitrososphaerota archaeon]